MGYWDKLRDKMGIGDHSGASAHNSTIDAQWESDAMRYLAGEYDDAIAAQEKTGEAVCGVPLAGLCPFPVEEYCGTHDAEWRDANTEWDTALLGLESTTAPAKVAPPKSQKCGEPFSQKCKWLNTDACWMHWDKGTYKSYAPRTCTHWHETINLLHGVKVYASASSDDPTPYNFFTPMFADFGLYLDSAWMRSFDTTWTNGFYAPWKDKDDKKVIVWEWPDYGKPAKPEELRLCLEYLLKQATKGKTVEVGCIGGHGRTGTALASFLVIQGMTPKQAIKHVREEYCIKAVEGDKQVKFLADLHQMVKGGQTGK